MLISPRLGNLYGVHPTVKESARLLDENEPTCLPSVVRDKTTISAHTKTAPQEGRSAPWVIAKLGEVEPVRTRLKAYVMVDLQDEDDQVRSKKAVQGGDS